jgi:hypothetical protein
VKEQSHIEEMRAAVRGDIERAKRRSGDGALAAALRSEPATSPETKPEPAPEGLGSRIAGLFRRS